MRRRVGAFARAAVHLKTSPFAPSPALVPQPQKFSCHFPGIYFPGPMTNPLLNYPYSVVIAPDPPWSGLFDALLAGSEPQAVISPPIPGFVMGKIAGRSDESGEIDVISFGCALSSAEHAALSLIFSRRMIKILSVHKEIGGEPGNRTQLTSCPVMPR